MHDKLAIRLWIERRLGRHDNVVDFYFFGSFLTSACEFRDVDVVVIFSAWDQYSFLVNTSRLFRCRFGIPLHIQSFHTAQHEVIDQFLRDAGVPR